MAGNWGKFIDRSPIICAAGKSSGDPTQTVWSCLQNYSLQSQVDALKHDAGVFDEHQIPFTYKLPIPRNNRHRGIYTESRFVLQPPVKTRYQTLINDLKETSYDSYWHKLQGRTRDPIPGLPEGTDIINTTFGKPTPTTCTVKELVNPPKTVYQVLWDSQVAHDMYKKTHNDYNPSEKIDRGYLKPPFNPNRRYGEQTEYDPRGIWVRCACHWHNNEPITSTNKIQADVVKRTHHQVGKCLAPNNNKECVPEEHRFGKPSKRHLYGVEELLKDATCPPCIFKRDFHTWMKHLNELRIHIKKLFNKFDFDLKSFYNRNLYFDKEHTGWIPLQLFYKLCKCSGLKYEHEALEPLFKFIKVIQDDHINYQQFIFIVDINNSLPEIIKINDIPEGSLYYITTYLASVCDFLKIDNSKLPTAGIPSLRYDLPRPNVPPKQCKADLENLGDDTTAGAVINPSIYTNYGLSYIDFFTPRDSSVMKKIFTNIGYQFPENTFQKLWDIGVKHDKTGSVCINTFKQLLKERVPPPQLILRDNNDEC